MAPVDLSKYSKFDKKRLSKLHEWSHHLSWFGLNVFYWYKGYKIQLHGKEKIPSLKQGPVVIVGTHSSLLDIPMVSHVMDYKPIAYLAKEELFIHWLPRFYFFLSNAIAVNRKKPEVSTFRACKLLIDSGRWYIAIFPEGTRTKGNEVGEMKKGAAMIARSNKAGILPIGIARQDKHISVRVGDFVPYDPSWTNDSLSELIREKLVQLKKIAEGDLPPAPESTNKSIAEPSADMLSPEVGPVESPTP